VVTENGPILQISVHPPSLCKASAMYGVTAPVNHGSRVTWVMGQELNGSLGSWVTLSDPFLALAYTVDVMQGHGIARTK